MIEQKEDGSVVSKDSNPVLDWIEEHGIENCIYSAYELGQAYYFRCALYSSIGRVVGYAKDLSVLILDDCSYVTSDGRYSEFIANGTHESAELEYMGNGKRLHTDAINDADPWPHPLPGPNKN
jgi:hypothetical protein